MKANELMLGDFVFHEKYGNAIVETIDNDFGDNPSVKLISENIKHKDGYKYGYCWCDLEEIFSIPLTPEILEKNGFNIEIAPYTPDWKRCILNPNFFLEDRLKGFYHFNGNNLAEIQYVHELQHALKLCNIDKEIVL